MPKFFETAEGSWINPELVAAATVNGKQVFFNYLGGHVGEIFPTEDEAQQELSNFLAHCEGQFEE